MKSNTLSIFKAVIFSTFLCLFVATSSYGGEYKAIDGLKDIKVVFDVRAKRVKKAAIYLDLIFPDIPASYNVYFREGRTSGNFSAEDDSYFYPICVRNL